MALVTLRAVESASLFWLMDWLRGLHRVKPMLALELTIASSPVLVELLSRAALDIAMAALPAAGSSKNRGPERENFGLPCSPQALMMQPDAMLRPGATSSQGLRGA